MVERAVVGLLRLAIRLLRREEISAQVRDFGKAYWGFVATSGNTGNQLLLDGPTFNLSVLQVTTSSSCK